MKISILIRSGAAAAALVLGGSQAAAQSSNSGSGSLRLSVGANYSSGNYDDIEDTEVFSIPVGLRYATRNFNVRVTVPYVFLNGPGSLIDTPEGRGSGGRGGDNSGPGSGHSGSGSGEVGDDDGGTPATDRHRQGLGDASISATYSFPLGGGLYLDANGRIKLPTASRSKRLGTGEVDITAGADLVADVGKATLYAGGRRKFVGSSTALPLRDVWIAGAGASVRITPSVTLGGDYSWQQSSRIGGGDISEATASASLRLSKSLRLTVYGTTGFTSNSADFAGGTSLSVRL